jgi:transposase
MAPKNKIYQVAPEDRPTLEKWVRSHTAAQNIVLRSRILLQCDAGKTVETVAAELGTSTNTVYKWLKRYQADGLEGIRDLPRSGQPRKLSQKKVEEVLRLTQTRVPKGATHWSLRLMAKHAGITVWQVQQIWQAAGLKPHRIQTFKISNDPEFAEKVVDVVGLYMNPPENAMILSVDEKTQIQALDRTQPMLQLRPGQVARRTHDYKRNGTRSLYAAFDILTGKVIGRVTDKHRAKEFLDFLRQIDRSTPKDLDLHLILDNSSAHKTEDVRNWLEQHPRFKVHFTPTSASWLNAVEGWFSQLERRALYRGVFSNVKELRDAIHRYIATHNEQHAKPFKWTKTATAILDSVQRAKESMGVNKKN